MSADRHRRRIELLAPARDLECGLEAVRHGADAVYIGAPRFGARAAAAVAEKDIAALVAAAHVYGVRVYVALNTLLRDDELASARAMARRLWRMGVDALIVQDMALLGPGMPPIPLHASTQTDNRTADKVEFLARAGVERVVVARELSPTDIGRIHRQVPDVELEAFVHGALCVSYSGQCYASCAAHGGGRSANRGECAQFCRLAFDLVDADGRKLIAGEHLLSLKDMNRLDLLEELLDAGVTSLKIEGRLKDKSYVKNVTAAYRQRLDEILARRSAEYERASSGVCRFSFTPSLAKSFNRGFTPYLWPLAEGDAGVSVPDTPGATGEPMGRVKAQRGNLLSVAGTKPFHNGDGICLADSRGRWTGCRVNRVEPDGKLCLGPSAPGEPPLRVLAGTRVYRNHDQAFCQELARPSSAVRKIRVRWRVEENAFGFTLSLTDEDGNRFSLACPSAKEPARTPQAGAWRTALGKLGHTPFEVDESLPGGGIELGLRDEWFVPAAWLAEWRRLAVERMEMLRRVVYRQAYAIRRPTGHRYESRELTYLGNVMNSAARDFYLQHGVEQVAPAYELRPVEGAVLMFCRHCLKRARGWCLKHGGKMPPGREPYYLASADGRRYRLEFDCRNCRMLVYDDDGRRK